MRVSRKARIFNFDQNLQSSCQEIPEVQSRNVGSFLFQNIPTSIGNKTKFNLKLTFSAILNISLLASNFPLGIPN